MHMRLGSIPGEEEVEEQHTGENRTYDLLVRVMLIYQTKPPWAYRHFLVCSLALLNQTSTTSHKTINIRAYMGNVESDETYGQPLIV